MRWWLLALLLVPVMESRGCVRTAEAADDGVLNLVLIGSKFTEADAAKYQANVASITSQVLATEPYKSLAQKIVISSVTYYGDLGCWHYPTASSRLIICDQMAIGRLLTSMGVTYDQVGVIVNDTVYGGGGGPITTASNYQSMSKVFVHEFAHTLGYYGNGTPILDEYKLYSSNGVIDHTPHQNCYAGVPPTGWSPVTTYLGCTYPNWYRPSYSSLMKSLSSNSYNAVTVALLKKALTRWIHGIP